MMLYPAISSISTWFTKRRALALGLTSTGKQAHLSTLENGYSQTETTDDDDITGGSIGGIVFPLIFESVQPAYGFAWAMRACALVVFTLAVCDPPHGILSPKILGSLTYTLLSIGPRLWLMSRFPRVSGLSRENFISVNISRPSGVDHTGSSVWPC